MTENQYAIAYNEVLEILKYIPKEDYNKIPQEKLNVFKTNASKDCKFKYDPKKTLDEQNVSKKAKAIIGLLFRDYWATEGQRVQIIKKQNHDRIKIEKEKQKKYNKNDIFKEEPTSQNSVDIENISIIEYKESLILKILKKFKRILKISKK